jgi:hypothetical protein
MDLKIDSQAGRISAAQKAAFDRDGFIKNLPVFAPEGVAQLQEMLEEWSGRVPKEIDISRERIAGLMPHIYPTNINFFWNSAGPFF